VKVALAWDARIVFMNLPPFGNIMVGSTLSVDFDLAIFDSRGTQVGGSASFDNSYEIAEFDARPGQTYTIKVRRWSGTDDVWYGIAWTITGGLLWSDVTRFTVLETMMS
jgi:hypothetical protein